MGKSEERKRAERMKVQFRQAFNELINRYRNPVKGIAWVSAHVLNVRTCAFCEAVKGDCLECPIAMVDKGNWMGGCVYQPIYKTVQKAKLYYIVYRGKWWRWRKLKKALGMAADWLEKRRDEG